MNSMNYRLTLLLALVALAVLAIGSAPLLAQDDPAEEPAGEETVVVAEESEETEPAEESAEEPTFGANTDLASVSVALDTVWVMITAFLVMWMQAGFGLVEAGLTRAKSAVNICMKNLMDFSFGSLAFWAVGFGIMFSAGNAFMGNEGFFLNSEADFSPIGWTSVPLEAKFFFQMVFAATAATIVSGAMAERTKFASYMLYSIFITALIYPISGHWIWGGGWLASLETPFWDFAGSTVVHSVGGWLALVGAFVLGPRTGKYDAAGNPRALPGHNIPMVMLGVFILWLGWFGFNPGSTMSANAVDIAHITCTTNSAAAAGAIVAMFVSKMMFGKWEATMALNGALAGLVAITAPCYWVTIPSAIIIGAVGGALVVFSVVCIDRFLKVDDPVGAISVHGVCGAWGTLALGLFAVENTDASAAPLTGMLWSGDPTQLISQAIGVGSVFAWCMVTGAICFFGIKAIMGLRVSPEEEAEGLDFGEHGNEAYHGFQFTSQS